MEHVSVRGALVRAVAADITGVKADAIVNPANTRLVMGGGLAAAIKSKGGSDIEREAMAAGPIQPGEAVITAAGTLPARYVIHAATMGMDFKTDENMIRSATASALAAAQERTMTSLALPALGCGVGRFPPAAAAKIMAQEVFRYLNETTGCSLKEIVFCLRDESTRHVFELNALGYLDYIVNRLKPPFLTVDAIIETEGGIVLIKRKNPPFGWALPGGFVDYGESLEDAVCREALEETGLRLKDVRQFHTYSAPGRDPRFHTVSTVFTARAEGTPVASDDAAEVRIVPAGQIGVFPLAFDHSAIITEYVKSGEKQ